MAGSGLARRWLLLQEDGLIQPPLDVTLTFPTRLESAGAQTQIIRSLNINCLCFGLQVHPCLFHKERVQRVALVSLLASVSSSPGPGGQPRGCQASRACILAVPVCAKRGLQGPPHLGSGLVTSSSPTLKWHLTVRVHMHFFRLLLDQELVKHCQWARFCSLPIFVTGTHPASFFPVPSQLLS